MIRQHTENIHFRAKYAVMLLCVLSITAAPFSIPASSHAATGSVITPSSTSMMVGSVNWQQGAQEYKSAMSIVSQVSAMSLRTKEDVTRAIGLLQKATPSIQKNVIAVVIQTAADDSTVKNSVKAALEKRCAGERDFKKFVACVTGFLNEVRRNRAAFNEAGGAAGLRAVQARLRSDSELLNRVSTNLINAVTTLKRQGVTSLNTDKNLDVGVETRELRVGGEANPRPRFNTMRVSYRVSEFASQDSQAASDWITVLTGAAEAICNVGAVVLTGGTGIPACIAGGVAVAVVAAAIFYAYIMWDHYFTKIPRLSSNPNEVPIPETALQICLDKEETEHHQCNDKVKPGDWIAGGLCEAAHLAGLARCYLLPGF